MMKQYVFMVELENGKEKKVHAYAKHINGAVRRVLQENDIVRFIRIIND